MTWLWAAFAVNSAVTIVSALLATFVLTSYVRRRNGQPAVQPQCSGPDQLDERDGLSLIVPIKGADDNTERLLTRLVQSDPGRPVEFLFAMESAHDPAYPVCQQVAAANPDRAIRIVLTGRPDGLMGKQHNLAAASREARYEWIGSMDADVAVEPDTLATLIERLETPDTGTAFALPYYDGLAPAGGTLVSVYTNFFFIPFMGAWATTGTAPFIIGGLWIARHDTLKRAGGFGQFGLTVSDDAIIGRSVRQLGLRNRLAPAAVAMPAENLELPGGIRHLRKWLGMLRAEGVHALLATLTGWYPLFWAVLTVLVGIWLGHPFLAPSLWLGAAVVVLRLAMAARLNTAVYRTTPWRHIGALLAYELLAPLLLVLPALFRRSIEWKGRLYRIGKGGRILQTEDVSP